MIRRLLSVVLAAALASCGGNRRATGEDCAALLDKLVQLEAHEHGLQDPALVDRWRATAKAKYAPDLAACRGRRLPSSAMACAAQATTAEELAHHCLR